MSGLMQRGSDTYPEDKCERHGGEVLLYYCNTHKSLCCGLCLSLDHISCMDVDKIKDVSVNIRDSDELKSVRSELRQLDARFRKKGTGTECMKIIIYGQYKQMLKQIDEIREENINYVETMAETAIQDATKLKDEILKELDQWDKLIKEIEKVTTELETRRHFGVNNCLYVAMKRAKYRLPHLQDEADKVNSQVPRRLVFERDESSRDQIGRVFMTDIPSRVEHVLDLNVSSYEDTGNCLIQGISLVSGDRLAITDLNNSALKVVDIIKRKVTDQIKTSSPPLDLTSMEDGEFAVTLKGERIIQVFSVTPRLAKSREIPVQHLYAGIEYIQEKRIFVVRQQKVEQDTAIHICNASGQPTLTIETTIKAPSHITLSPTIDVLCVSDSYRNTVESFDISGIDLLSTGTFRKFVSLPASMSSAYRHETTSSDRAGVVSTYTYSDKELQRPRGIATDEYGCVYICSRETNSIHQMIPGTPSNGRRIVTSEHGLKFPIAMAYDDEHLYISSASSDPELCNVIKVFKLINIEQSELKEYL